MSLHKLSRNFDLGSSPGVSHINKFGENPVSPADTAEDVWSPGGTYSFPATALITSMSQTTNQAALLGAKIEIQGLDANWDMVVQTKALNATNTTTVVTLATPLIRVFRAKNLSLVVCDAQIRIHNAGESVDYAVIDIGDNQTLMAIYTIPAGKTGYMTSYYCHNIDAGGKTPTATEVKLMAQNTTLGHAFAVKHEFGIPEAGPGVQHYFNPYYQFAEKTDIKVRTECLDQDGNVHAGFDIILIDNSERAARPGADTLGLTGGALTIVNTS